VCQVQLKQISEKVQNALPIREECLRFCRFCFIWFLPVFVLLLFLPEGFFTFVLGERWAGVGFYLKIQLPMLFFSLVVASLSCLPDVLFRQKETMDIEVVYVIFKVLALVTGMVFGSFTLAVAAFCAVAVAGNAYKLFWYFSIIKKYEISLLQKKIND